jgi:uncharacterized protein YdhG (YjbR/CyaY superfamily)
MFVVDALSDTLRFENVRAWMPFVFWHSRTVHPDTTKSLIFIQLNAQLDYSKLKRTLKFTIKCSYMFRLTNHHQRAYCRALLKL